MSRRVALLVSGASGMLLPRHLLGRLAEHPEVERIHLAVSAGASQVLRHELGPEKTGAADLVEAAGLPERAREKISLHRDNELDAPIASGSYRLAGTVVLPCSAGTLGALATGSARTLVHRAGAVALKERWPLVLGFRETPLSLVHVENMRRLLYAGAVILPPVPAFYIAGAGDGEDLGRFLDHYAMRILDKLGLDTPGEGLRWGEGA
ncbi:MAG TPA: UbiX family flavin prenyltransferase [Thermoanaerobaculia bacterium]|nr:UbiX family flavin prenyltransferase [Thermoanaerobaculia bacterium]